MSRQPNEELPCDVVLLATTGELGAGPGGGTGGQSAQGGGECFITTANVDGEANLKVRTSAPETQQCADPHYLADHHVTMTISEPHPNLDSFTGVIRVFNASQRIKTEATALATAAVDTNQLLLKGSLLKSSTPVYGVAIYTGKDSKIALNQRCVIERQLL